MDIRVVEARLDQKPVLHRLMQLYLHDSSEFTGDDVSRDGEFRYRYFEEYWQEPDRFPFLIYYGANLAGFVLVNTHTVVLEQGAGRSIAEFFVMRKYRKQGVGRRAAFYAFDRFRGLWEIRENINNLAGQEFWRRIIAEYTGGEFSETVLNSPGWIGPVQTFDNSRKGLRSGKMISPRLLLETSYELSVGCAPSCMVFSVHGAPIGHLACERERLWKENTLSPSEEPDRSRPGCTRFTAMFCL